MTMNLYRVTFHAELLIEAESPEEACELPGWEGDPSDLLPIADLIGDVEDLARDSAEYDEFRRTGN